MPAKKKAVKKTTFTRWPEVVLSNEQEHEQKLRMDHEVLDRAYLVAEMFQDKLATHPHLTKKQKKQAAQISEKLWRFYSDAFDGGSK